MSSVLHQTPSSRHQEPTPQSRRYLVSAWASTALVPVFILVGRAASISFLASRGYDSDETEPPGVGLVAFFLLALITFVPVIAAGWFGLHASRGGRPAGMRAARIALGIGGGFVLLGLPLFLSRLLGWPVVLAIGAALGVVAVVITRDWREHHPSGPTPFLGR